jgi:hypothetical protein
VIERRAIKGREPIAEAIFFITGFVCLLELRNSTVNRLTRSTSEVTLA